MKKVIFSLVITVLLVIGASFCVSAAQEITVTDGTGKTVAAFEIETDNLQVDSRDYLQKAMTYCRDNATDGNIHTVTVPEGEYVFTQSLNVHSNTVLDFSGATVYRGGSCGSVIRFGAGSAVVYGYDGYRNITVKNLTIDSNDTGNTSLVRFAHASNVEFNNVHIKNTTNVNHMLTFAACDGVRLIGCSFSDMEISESKAVFNCEAVQIDILKEGYFSYPAQDGTRTKNVTVTGCTFRDVPRGLGTHSAIAGYYFDNMIFRDNIFENIESYAIKAINYTNSEISGNKIINCGSGISCSTITNTALKNYYAPMDSRAAVTGKMNVKISGNTLSLTSNGADTTAYGIRVQGADIESFTDADGKSMTADCRISAVQVENNSITSSVYQKNFYGIHIDGASGIGYGNSSDVTVKNNTVTFSDGTKADTTVYGIKIENSKNVSLYSNGISDEKRNMHAGIVSDNSEGIYIYGNTVSGTNAFGIKFDGTKNSDIIRNTVKNTGSNGIYITEASSGISVQTNSISDSKGYGIAVSDAQTKAVKNNKIYRSGKYGIYFTKKSKGNTVTANYICNSKGTGIYLNSDASVKTVSKNRIDITRKTADGITVNDKATVTNITGNKINAKTDKDSKKLKVKCKYGIRINSSACKVKKITGNNINNSYNTAIYIAKTKTKVTLQKNKITKAVYGIACPKNKAKIKTNTFSGCSKASIKTL